MSSDANIPEPAPDVSSSSDTQELERGTYEIIRNRLDAHASELRGRLEQLNHDRREVFGSIETKLLSTERITTANNCVPCDMKAIGERFIFGYNVHIGLRAETHLEDVFSVHSFREGTFHSEPLDLISDDLFISDFKQLYKYYKDTTFLRFQSRGPHLYMVFRVGRNVTDIKAFKWFIDGDSLKYMDNRSDHELTYPPQHEFEWIRTHRDLHRQGLHPHITIDDRIFVETVGGDLTIKVEDNTDIGHGIYAEPVDDADQVLDDAEVFYAVVGNLILLKIKPYQEDKFRYLIYNDKLQTAMRLDAIEHSCVLLPEDHGIIFSNGYYLQTGEWKVYDNAQEDLLFERRLASPNGEDDLYVFFNRDEGIYVLLSYNMIEQHVETPIVCHGFSFFPDGHLVYFKAGDDPQKHHALQIWQTPYVAEDFTPHEQTDSFLYKIGNKDVVRGMSECHEIINLIGKDESYANLYVDLVKKSGDVIDSYFWLSNDETHRLDEPLQQIRDASSAAVSEFDKVVRVRRETKTQFTDVATRADRTLADIRAKRFDHISVFVDALAESRKLRGEIVSLKDLRYVDLPAVDGLETEIAESTERLSRQCVEFLLRDGSLTPYEQRVVQQKSEISTVEKVADARQLEDELLNGAAELEMLIDIVSNLKIDDATQRTQIIDSISTIFANLNQARASLKKRSQELMSVEGAAEFHSQMKLLSQSVVNYLDVCDTPEKCDEYLTKVMVQVEELEGKFAEFDEFIIQLSEKREEVYSAFDTRKVAIVEARNKRATALQSAADRILNGIKTRVAGFDSVNDINSYFASDLMIEKVREIVQQLTDLEDTVKVGDIQSRLKTIREDAVRQLKDRQELYVDGKNVIRFGKHLFSVNVQDLDLTTVVKDDGMYFHLAGTNYLERIDDERLQSASGVWDQEVVSENREVYRAEFLAYLYVQHLTNNGNAATTKMVDSSEADLTAAIQAFMAPRYAEGYVKGVHDHDAARITKGLLEIRDSVGLLRYAPSARALATVFWHTYKDSEDGRRLETKLKAGGQIRKLFPSARHEHAFTDQLVVELKKFNEQHGLFAPGLIEDAASYLADELTNTHAFVADHHALAVCRGFQQHLERRHQVDAFRETLSAIEGDVKGQFMLLRQWVTAYLAEEASPAPQPPHEGLIDESVAILFDHSMRERTAINAEVTRTLSGLVGSHSVTEGSEYELDYLDFTSRLTSFHRDAVPQFEEFVATKRRITDEARESLRLSEFKPRVLTSFVRNKLIDEVYLPMIGDNLAKQMGVVGEGKRTDLMGLLLLISPPGYGKTTLMEYVANRLGITFMKINGPAIGHQVTSLDPAEAPNASAREEVEKLNLALEMGDNVMIYLDDIQHCNPEFLQKFISLCDGQRKIEGVFKARTRTYDLRGRKVAVVMAGNPYTESGDKFQIPDMLANRADTYNLGDVIGSSSTAFQLSYLENALTSNPTLNNLASRSTKDVYAIIQMAEADSPEGIELEADYSVEELNELVNVMRKLIRVRDVVLRVNEQYIASAAQADAYRTEPPFKLQGSYRDMNKIAERVVPIMNDEELETLIGAHYENSAQTLTTGAEANLLKLKQMLGKLTNEDARRWDDIKKTFGRNLLLGSSGEDDQVGRVVAQLTTFTDGLQQIKDTLELGIQQIATTAGDQSAPTEVSISGLDSVVESVSQFSQSLADINKVLDKHFANQQDVTPRPDGTSPSTTKSPPQEIRVINRVPSAFLEVIRSQFGLIQAWMKPIQDLPADKREDYAMLTRSLDEAFKRYEQLIKKTENDTAIVKRQRSKKGTQDS